MSYLLDTCVLSEYIKKQPAPQVISWLDAQDEDGLFISTISIGEIFKGITKLQTTDPPRAIKLNTWLETLEARFEYRTLVLDNTIMRVWGELYGTAEQQGRSLPLMDSLIMASAAHYDLSIVTRNSSDFSGYSKTFNPWEVSLSRG